MPVKRWNFSDPVKNKLDDLIRGHEHWSATAIYADLVEWAEDKKAGGLPALRTVQVYVKASRPLDTSEAWVPADYSGEDAALVLEIVTEARMIGMLDSGAPPFWPTNDRANKILWLRRAAPSINPVFCWLLSGFFEMYEAREESTEPLLWLLTFRPWESSDALEVYDNACEAGHFTRASDVLMQREVIFDRSDWRHPGYWEMYE